MSTLTTLSINRLTHNQLNALGAIPTLINLSTSDPSQQTRKKAILALSSAIRNYQPNLDVALKYLPDEHKVVGSVDAMDMEAIDPIISKLREASAKLGNGDANGGSCGVDGVCS
jgi:hsp70-interacting protein